MFAELFESSIALNIQYYSSQAFQAIVNLLGQIEQLLSPDIYSSDSINIPPNTMVVFDLYPLAQGDQYRTIDPGRFLQPAQQHAGKEEIISPANNHYLGQFPFVPFFAGQRMCPAFAVTEVLFKVILAKLVADYELQFVNNGDGDFTLHIEPKFKFPELIQYALIP